MKFTDYTKIKGITFKYPELMNDTSESQLIELFSTIESLKDEIADMRMIASRKEKELNKLEKKWDTIKDLIIIDWGTFEKEVVHEDINVGFNFSADINKNIH